MMAEAGMMLQAQSLLDQLPMDMGTAKDKIETELREHGDAARQGIEEIQAGHKQEIKEQVTAHKILLHSLIGPSREHNTLPNPAQHASRTTLRNEIARMIRNNLGANTAGKRRTRLTKHMTKELDRKIETLAANHDREMETIE
jgi:FKBP-type peptidyl-prolyl cis-trans isomerase (trigger factor)